MRLIVLLRRFFSGKSASGIRLRRRSVAPSPSLRRKHYSSQSGYQYEYFYEGYRPFRSRGESGTRLSFRFADRPIADRNTWPAVGVFLPEAVLRAWEQTHGRELSAAECYAIAKSALLQAFDQRSSPAQMRQPVHVRRADLEAIAAALQID
jgi:hypothetical protein